MLTLFGVPGDIIGEDKSLSTIGASSWNKLLVRPGWMMSTSSGVIVLGVL